MKAKSRFRSLIRSFAGILIAAFLVYKTLSMTGGNLFGALARADAAFLSFSFAFYGAILCLSTFRWKLLLGVQGIDLRMRDILRLTFIGVFFNLALPGAVGGDVVKISLLMQHLKEKKEEAVLSMVLDRALGLFGLFLVTSFVVVASLPFLRGLDPTYRPVQIGAYAVGCGSLFGLAFMALVEFRKSVTSFAFVRMCIGKAERKLPASVVGSLRRLDAAIELYRRSRKTLAGAVALSVLVHIGLAVNLYAIGAGLGEKVLDLGRYLLIVPVANAIAAVPITPGGIGTRDATIAMFFAAMQVPEELIGIVPVTLTLVILFWGFVGGMIFVFIRR